MRERYPIEDRTSPPPTSQVVLPSKAALATTPFSHGRSASIADHPDAPSLYLCTPHPHATSPAEPRSKRVRLQDIGHPGTGSQALAPLRTKEVYAKTTGPSDVIAPSK